MMIEGSLITHIPVNNLLQNVWAKVSFPELTFVFRNTGPRNTCEVFHTHNATEEKIGQSTQHKKGFLFAAKRFETLNFNYLHEHSITIETGLLNRWIHYQGERNKFMFTICQEKEDEQELCATEEELDDPEDQKPKTNREWRSFEVGPSRLEHHDFENHYRIFAPNESEGLLVAFVAFRFWASTNESD